MTINQPHRGTQTSRLGRIHGSRGCPPRRRAGIRRSVSRACLPRRRSGRRRPVSRAWLHRRRSGSRVSLRRSGSRAPGCLCRSGALRTFAKGERTRSSAQRLHVMMGLGRMQYTRFNRTSPGLMPRTLLLFPCAPCVPPSCGTCAAAHACFFFSDDIQALFLDLLY